jgi:thiamine phosphate synthase YjbQ (UPF0047 family)
MQADLCACIGRLVPLADAPQLHDLKHTADAADGLPAQIKAALLPVSLKTSLTRDRLALGSCQGILLLEHRARLFRPQMMAYLAWPPPIWWPELPTTQNLDGSL